MAAMTKPRKLSSMAESPRQWPLKPGVKILQGAQLGLVRGAGYVDNLTADPTMIAVGAARHTVDNTASLSPAPEVYADPGIYPLFASGLTQADEGKVCYAVDNQTFSLSSNGGTRPILGEVWEVVDATTAYVKINPTPALALLANANSAEPGANLTDANATIQVTAGSWRILPAATLTANRVLTLGTTGAVKGDVQTVTRLDVGAFTYTINNGGAGAGTLVVLPVSKPGFLDAYFDGTNWTPKKLGTV